MSEITKILRCKNCGEILQDEDPALPGFIDSNILHNHKSEILMCNECYNKLIYNSKPTINDIDDEYYSILLDAKATESLIVLVLDLFSFEGSISKRALEALEDSNIIVVGNKRDLFPKNIDDNVLKEYVYHELRKQDLNVKEVILTSALEDYNIKLLLQRVDEIRQRHDVYVIGLPNSGKSQLVNSLFKHFKNKTNRLITTINYPGTSISAVEFPLDRTTNLYDIPGMRSRSSLTEIVESNIANQILFRKPVDIQRATLSTKTGIAFGGLARIDLLKGNKIEVKIFISDKIECRAVKGKELDSMFFYMIEKKSLKPISKNYTKPDDFDIYDVNIDEEGNRDIGILGLGWISFKGNGQKFRITVPKGVYVYTTRAKVQLHAKKQRY